MSREKCDHCKCSLDLNDPCGYGFCEEKHVLCVKCYEKCWDENEEADDDDFIVDNIPKELCVVCQKDSENEKKIKTETKIEKKSKKIQSIRSKLTNSMKKKILNSERYESKGISFSYYTGECEYYDLTSQVEHIIDVSICVDHNIDANHKLNICSSSLLINEAKSKVAKSGKCSILDKMVTMNYMMAKSRNIVKFLERLDSKKKLDVQKGISKKYDFITFQESGVPCFKVKCQQEQDYLEIIQTLYTIPSNSEGFFELNSQYKTSTLIMERCEFMNSCKKKFIRHESIPLPNSLRLLIDFILDDITVIPEEYFTNIYPTLIGISGLSGYFSRWGMEFGNFGPKKHFIEKILGVILFTRGSDSEELSK